MSFCLWLEMMIIMTIPCRITKLVVRYEEVKANLSAVVIIGIALKENDLREAIEGCTNQVAVFLSNYPVNKQQLDVLTSEVNISLFSLIILGKKIQPCFSN